MFIIRLFLGGCISCCWHFRAGGNCSGTDGHKEAVAEAMQQRGKRSSTCSRMLRSRREGKKQYILVAGCYAAAEVEIITQ